MSQAPRGPVQCLALPDHPWCEHVSAYLMYFMPLRSCMQSHARLSLGCSAAHQRPPVRYPNLKPSLL